MEAIKIAIIGTGYWGPNYVRNFSEIKGVEIAYICDLDSKKLEPISERYPQIKTTKDYREILGDPSISSVIICTPTSTHFKIARDCLDADKHVLVEKPITLSSKDALELVKLADKKKKILMVGHVFEYNHAVRMVKDYIKKKEMGDILYLHSSRTGLGPIRQDVNVIWDLAAHDVSILLHLLDKKPLNIVARGESYIQKGVEDVVFVNIEFEGKIMANIHVSWLDPIKIRQTVVVGTKKMLVFDDVSSSEKLKVFDKGVSYEKPGGTFGDFQLLVRDGDILIPKVKFTEPLKEQCLHFLDSIKNNKKPLTDGMNGYSVVKVLEAAQESLKNHSKVVQIDLR